MVKIAQGVITARIGNVRGGYSVDTRQIAWNDVWIGAAIASLLFTARKVLIGLYLRRSVVTSAYGAVSSPLVVLGRIYYSAQILLFGAEITHVYANRRGSRVELVLEQRLRAGGGLGLSLITLPKSNSNGPPRAEILSPPAIVLRSTV